MELKLKAKSSNGESFYIISCLSNDNGLITIHCNCQAGILGKHCKHKRRLLCGDESVLFDSSQVDDLRTLNLVATQRGIVDHYEKLSLIESQIDGLIKEQKRRSKEIDLKLAAEQNILSSADYIKENMEVFNIDVSISYAKYLISKIKESVSLKVNLGF